MPHSGGSFITFGAKYSRRLTEWVRRRTSENERGLGVAGRVGRNGFGGSWSLRQVKPELRIKVPGSCELLEESRKMSKAGDVTVNTGSGGSASRVRGIKQLAHKPLPRHATVTRCGGT